MAIPNDRDRQWNDAVGAAANTYVEQRGYNGSCDALARKIVFVAAANTVTNIDTDEVLAEILAGRATGQTLTDSGL